MAGISYIRDAQRRQQSKKKKPKPATPAGATPGIDYIRNSTRNEIEAKNAAQKAAQRKAGVTAPASSAPSSPQAAVSTPAAPAPTPAKPAKVKKAPKPVTAATAPIAATSTPISSIFNSAQRELTRQEKIAEAQMNARMADQAAFDEYVARARSAANATLTGQFAASAQNAQTAREASLADVGKYTAQAIQAAGGNADVMNAAGTTAGIQSNLWNTAATIQDSYQANMNQATLSKYNVEQQEADLARSANMRSGFEADRRASLAEIAQRRSDLSLEEAKATIEQQNADRQFQLDQVLADYARAKGERELGLEAYNAETERIGTRTPEERARELDIEASRVEAQNARDRAAASGSSSPGKVAQDLNKWYDAEIERLAVPSVDAIGDGATRIDFGRRAIAQLKTMHPNLTPEAAMTALRGILPAHVLDEGYPDLPNGGIDPRNRIMYRIAQVFRG